MKNNRNSTQVQKDLATFLNQHISPNSGAEKVFGEVSVSPMVFRMSWSPSGSVGLFNMRPGTPSGYLEVLEFLLKELQGRPLVKQIGVETSSGPNAESALKEAGFKATTQHEWVWARSKGNPAKK
jgi:hypothetical protein